MPWLRPTTLFNLPLRSLNWETNWGGYWHCPLSRALKQCQTTLLETMLNNTAGNCSTLFHWLTTLMPRLNFFIPWWCPLIPIKEIQFFYSKSLNLAMFFVLLLYKSSKVNVPQVSKFRVLLFWDEDRTQTFKI